MKRMSQDYAGRPPRGMPRAGATGRRSLVSSRVQDVASFLDAEAPVAPLDEFAEFLSLDPTSSGGHGQPLALPDADPVFRERLRQRLWRVHQLTQLIRDGEPH